MSWWEEAALVYQGREHTLWTNFCEPHVKLTVGSSWGTRSSLHAHGCYSPAQTPCGDLRRVVQTLSGVLRARMTAVNVQYMATI